MREFESCNLIPESAGQQAVEVRARAFWDTTASEIDKQSAAMLFTVPKTTPRTRSDRLVSNGVVTPWVARAYAQLQVEAGNFIAAQAFSFMATSCRHYSDYLREQRQHDRRLVGEGDVVWCEELTVGFVKLARESRKLFEEALAKSLVRTSKNIVQ